MEENCFFCKVIFCPFAGIDDENICKHYKKGIIDMGNYQCRCHRCGKIFYGGDLTNWVYKWMGITSVHGHASGHTKKNRSI